MCITFLYVDNNPKLDGYQVIIANNRDEYFNRPTKQAQFWEDHPHCLSGLDAEPGREGGTWFGVSEYGRVGVLLNILTATGPLADKKNRGNLVSDFLHSSLDGANYISQLSLKGSEFNLFNLVLLERSPEHGWLLYYYMNGEGKPPLQLPQGVYGLSNSSLEEPFKKVQHGQALFTDIISKLSSVQQREELEEALLTLMSDTSRQEPDEKVITMGGDRLRKDASTAVALSNIFVKMGKEKTAQITHPDPQIEAQAGGSLTEDLLEQRSAISVQSPVISYGTRTTTLYFVDIYGRCDYIEKTMRQPISAQDPQWSTNRFSFTLENPPV